MSIINLLPKPLFKKLFFLSISSRVPILFIYIMNIFIIITLCRSDLFMISASESMYLKALIY